MNLMFQPQFEPLILSGRKPHTVRPKRKKPLKVGQPLSLRIWTGKPYRSKQREFAKARITKLADFHLDYCDVMTIGGERLTVFAQNAFAYADGFEHSDDMRQWFETTHHLPFDGQVICFETL